MNWQEIIVAAIILTAIGLTGYRLFNFFSTPPSKCHGCSGCSLKELKK